MKKGIQKKILSIIFIVILVSVIFLCRNYKYVKSKALRYAIEYSLGNGATNGNVSPFFRKASLKKISHLEIDVIYDDNYHDSSYTKPGEIDLSEINCMNNLSSIIIKDSHMESLINQVRNDEDAYIILVKKMSTVVGLDHLIFRDASIDLTLKDVRLSNESDLSCAKTLEIIDCDLRNYKWLDTCTNVENLSGYSPDIDIFKEGNKKITDIINETAIS